MSSWLQFYGLKILLLDLVFLHTCLFMSTERKTVSFRPNWAYFSLFWPIFVRGDLGKGGVNRGLFRTSRTPLSTFRPLLGSKMAKNTPQNRSFQYDFDPFYPPFWAPWSVQSRGYPWLRTWGPISPYDFLGLFTPFWPCQTLFWPPGALFGAGHFFFALFSRGFFEENPGISI